MSADRSSRAARRDAVRPAAPAAAAAAPHHTARKAAAAAGAPSRKRKSRGAAPRARRRSLTPQPGEPPLRSDSPGSDTDGPAAEGGAASKQTAVTAQLAAHTSGLSPDVSHTRATAATPGAHARQQPPPPVRTAAAAAATPRDALRDKYAGEPGLALSSWAARTRRMLAFYVGLPDDRAVAWLATGLEGAAGDWYDQLTAMQGRPLPSPDALFTGLRARFQPVNAAETARHELDTLHQEKGATVNEYTSRFLQLVAHLPNLDADTRMWQYRRGLTASVADRLTQAEPQPLTLEATIALAARIEGRSHCGRSHGEHLAAMSAPQLPSAPTPETTTASLVHRLAELEALVRAALPLLQARGNEPRRQVHGLAHEEAHRRMDSGLCLHCGQAGHILRGCPERAQGKAPTLTA